MQLYDVSFYCRESSSNDNNDGNNSNNNNPIPVTFFFFLNDLEHFFLCLHVRITFGGTCVHVLFGRILKLSQTDDDDDEVAEVYIANGQGKTKNTN